MLNSTKQLPELMMEVSSFLSLQVTIPKVARCDGRQLWGVVLLLGQDWPTPNQN